MKQKIFLDTNIILDFFLDREPFSTYAAKILSLAESTKITAYISPITISDCYYIMRKFEKAEKVTQKLQQLISIVEITKIDKETVEKALYSNFSDLEDALQNYSASQFNNIDLIVTRNIRDFRKSELAVMSPETYLKTLLSSEK